MQNHLNPANRVFTVYTIEQISSRRRANFEQTPSKRLANIELVQAGLMEWNPALAQM